MSHIPCQLNLSAAQIRKLKSGGTIQIKHTSIGHGHNLNLHPENIDKLCSAMKANKTCKLSLNDAEIEGSGLGKKIGHAFHSAKKAVDKTVHKANKEYKEVKHVLKDNHVGRKIVNSTAKVAKKLDQYAPLVEDIPVVSEAYAALQAGAHASNAISKEGVSASSKIDKMGKTIDAKEVKALGKSTLANMKKSALTANPKVKAAVQAAKDVSLVTKSVKKGEGIATIQTKIAKATKSVAKAKAADGNIKVYDDKNPRMRPDQAAFHPIKPDIIPKATKKGAGINKCKHCGGSFMAGGSFKA